DTIGSSRIERARGRAESAHVRAIIRVKPPRADPLRASGALVVRGMSKKVQAADPEVRQQLGEGHAALEGLTMSRNIRTTRVGICLGFIVIAATAGLVSGKNAALFRVAMVEVAGSPTSYSSFE